MCSSPNPTLSLAMLALIGGLRAGLGTWLIWSRYDWLLANCNPPSLGMRFALTLILGNPWIPKDRTYVKFTLILGWFAFLIFACGFVAALARC